MCVEKDSSEPVLHWCSQQFLNRESLNHDNSISWPSIGSTSTHLAEYALYCPVRQHHRVKVGNLPTQGLSCIQHKHWTYHWTHLFSYVWMRSSGASRHHVWLSGAGRKGQSVCRKSTWRTTISLQYSSKQDVRKTTMRESCTTKSPWRGIQERQSCVAPFNSGKERKVKEAAPPIVRTILYNKTTLWCHIQSAKFLK